LNYLRFLITGGAGFLGSYLVERLISEGYKVTVIDNLSSGCIDNIKTWLGCSTFRFIKSDLKSLDRWVEVFKNVDIVFHYAANPEVRVSVMDPKIHFKENLQATFNVLEACRNFKVRYLVFASTSTVYGDADKIPTPEDYHPLNPISIYGAVKLACEILIQTYSRLYGLKALILRYANIIGPKMKRGVIIDFINKLQVNPKKLEILGDGRQRKSYLYVEDAIDATLKALNYILDFEKTMEIFNVGSEDWITVEEIADIVTDAMNLRNVEYLYRSVTSDGRGWPGDVKLMLLDISKLKKTTGWTPRLNSREAVKFTVNNLIKENFGK